MSVELEALPDMGTEIGPAKMSFAEFFEAEAEALRRFGVFLAADEETGADLAQEVLARMYARWNRISQDDLGAYGRKALVNLWKSSLRRKITERRVLWRGSSSFGSHEPGVAEMLRITRALRTLPLTQRAAVVLRYYEDRELADIAAILGRKVGTVKSDLHRALARLRPLLEEDER